MLEHAPVLALQKTAALLSAVLVKGPSAIFFVSKRFFAKCLLSGTQQIKVAVTAIL
jgi:hypothetical protein